MKIPGEPARAGMVVRCECGAELRIVLRDEFTPGTGPSITMSITVGRCDRCSRSEPTPKCSFSGENGRCDEPAVVRVGLFGREGEPQCFDHAAARMAMRDGDDVVCSAL